MNHKLFFICLSLFSGLALAAACLLLPGRSLASRTEAPAAGVRYLSPGGADSGDCSQASTPCQSVQYAIDQAAPGDELHLAAGRFAGVQNVGGNLQVASLSKSLSLRGGYTATFSLHDPLAYTTTLDAAGGGRVIYASGAITVTLDGLRLVNGDWKNDGSRLPAGGCVYGKDANLKLLGVIVQSCTSPNGQGSGVYQLRGGLLISDSLVQGNHSIPGVWNGGGWGGGVYAEAAQVLIQSTTILSNTAAQVGYLDSGRGGGVYLSNCQSVVQDSVLKGNQASNLNGDGGGMYASGGSLRLLNNRFEANTAAGYVYGSGGGLLLNVNSALLDGNAFINNVGFHEVTNDPSNGSGGGVSIGASLAVTLTNNLFQGNFSYMGGGFGASNQRVLLLQGNRFIANHGRTGGGVNLLSNSVPAGLVSRVSLIGNEFQDNYAQDKGGGAYLIGPVQVKYNHFDGNQARLEGGGVYQDEGSRNDLGQAAYDGDLFTGNSAPSGGGLMLTPVFSPDLNLTYQNLAFRGNRASSKGAAVYVHKYANTPVRFNHFTLGDNPGGDGMIYIIMGKVTISNTILYSATVGVGANTCVQLNHVLRNKVTTPVQIGANVYGCPPPESSPLSGDPALAADMVHLTAASAAVDAGGPSGVYTDYDGEPRPLGAAPDVGADESPYSRSAAGMQAALLPGTAHWMAAYSGVNKPPSTFFQQDYLLPFAYSALVTAPQVSKYSLLDTFPTGLDLASVQYHPEMTYTQAGMALAWQSQAPLASGGFGWIGLVGQSLNIPPGTPLLTSGQMQYQLSNGQSASLPFQAQTVVPPRPLFPPVLMTPNDGEMCLDDSHSLYATGLASVGQTVRLFENGIAKGSALPNAAGEFEVSWTSSLDQYHPVWIETQSCTPSGQCSGFSRKVNLTLAQGDWCPQRSFWEGDAGGAHFTFYFRNDEGRYASNGFVIPGVSYFNNTLLHLYACCAGDTNPFKVTADGIDYPLPVSHSGRMWTFNIAFAHNVAIESACNRAGQVQVKTTYGRVLIDPDGFAFNAAGGGAYDPVSGMFAPHQPLAGITVTAYYSVPEWGGWIVWPAQMFNNQVNPQRTGANGYYAFFTPPGFYYLQADPGPKSPYQPWRSPLIQVITQIVHANAPLTPLPLAGLEREVSLAPQGAFPAAVSIPAGARVTFQAAPGPLGSLSDLSSLAANPLTRLLSSLNPLTDPLGFDSGMLGPGGVYRRRFTAPGIYPYSCGPGCSGSIRVLAAGPGLYLPLVRR